MKEALQRANNNQFFQNEMIYDKILDWIDLSKVAKTEQDEF